MSGRQLSLAVPVEEWPFGHEAQLQDWGYARIAGVDEAGRGPLAGPVFAAAVVFPNSSCPEGVADSKVLSPKRRDAAYDRIVACAEWGVGSASVQEIDALNILRATHLAMRRALENLPSPPDFALVDGLPVKGLPCSHRALVKGERRSASIAAASILAKVTRDRLMVELDARYPEYGFAVHKGYPTKDHFRALAECGPCPEHRLSFAPVAAALKDSATRRPPFAPTACQELGAEGERRAVDALRERGYEIVATNVHVGGGELDVIARHDGMWAFVEVKTRRGDAYGAPDEAVTPAKQRALLRAARAWLEENGSLDDDWRFDVATVRFHAGRPPRIEIIANAFGD